MTATKERTRAPKAPKVSTIHTAHGDSTPLVTRAVLVNVHIRVWQGRKYDQQITSEVHAERKAAADAGRYRKHLLGGHADSHAAVLAAAMQIRQTHYRESLPWQDEGWRILPITNHTHYTDVLRTVVAEFNRKVEQFLVDYPALREASRTKLGTRMFRASDYPATAELRGKFGCSIAFAPLPSGADFRVDLPTQELAAMAASVEARVLDSTRSAMAEAWQRLIDVVSSLTERLDDGLYLRAATIDRVRHMAEALGRLNLTNDPLLDATCARVITDLTKLSADELRDDDVARQATAKKAHNIMTSMRDIYGTQFGALTEES